MFWDVTSIGLQVCDSQSLSCSVGLQTFFVMNGVLLISLKMCHSEVQVISSYFDWFIVYLLLNNCLQRQDFCQMFMMFVGCVLLVLVFFTFTNSAEMCWIHLGVGVLHTQLLLSTVLLRNACVLFRSGKY